jgi:hypothetical protein
VQQQQQPHKPQPPRSSAGISKEQAQQQQQQQKSHPPQSSAGTSREQVQQQEQQQQEIETKRQEQLLKEQQAQQQEQQQQLVQEVESQRQEQRLKEQVQQRLQQYKWQELESKQLEQLLKDHEQQRLQQLTQEREAKQRRKQQEQVEEQQRQQQQKQQHKPLKIAPSPQKLQLVLGVPTPQAPLKRAARQGLVQGLVVHRGMVARVQGLGWLGRLRCPKRCVRRRRWCSRGWGRGRCVWVCVCVVYGVPIDNSIGNNSLLCICCKQFHDKHTQLSLSDPVAIVSSCT